MSYRPIRLASVSAFGVAAVAAAVVAVVGGTSTGASAQLVSFTGDQPAGFSLDKVPAGWEVQGADKHQLTLAPKDAADRDFRSCVGKICIGQEKQVPSVEQKKVQVGDRPAILATMQGDKDGAAGSLFVRQPSGNYLVIQVWDNLGWGEKQIVEFAEGVRVSPDAGVSVG